MKSNKYILKWQVARVSAKNAKDIDVKINIVKDYITKNPSINDKDRVLNWINGTILGFKDLNAKSKLLAFREYIESLVFSIQELPDGIFASYSEKTLVELVKDLYKRNKKWASKGYIHEDQVKFLTELYDFLIEQKIQLPTAYNKEAFLNDVELGSSIPNTHKFLY